MSRIMWGVETDPVTITRGLLLEIAQQGIYEPLWVDDAMFEPPKPKEE